jgi:hypothetical protein
MARSSGELKVSSPAATREKGATTPQAMSLPRIAINLVCNHDSERNSLIGRP